MGIPRRLEDAHRLPFHGDYIHAENPPAAYRFVTTLRIRWTGCRCPRSAAHHGPSCGQDCVLEAACGKTFRRSKACIPAASDARRPASAP